MRNSKTDRILKLLDKPEKEAVIKEEAPEPPVIKAKHKNPNLRIPNGVDIPVIYEKKTAGFQLVNVTFLLINEQLGQVMERFNCCMCEKCAAIITAEALKRIPPMLVPVRRKSDADKVNELAARSRSEVIKILTKAVITVKNNPKH